MEINNLKDKLIVIDNFVINMQSVSYFQHGIHAETFVPFVKFKMICGDNINFDFKNVMEYNETMSKIIEGFEHIGVEKTEKNTKKSIKSNKNVLKIV
jgi:hypothetical protein